MRHPHCFAALIVLALTLTGCSPSQPTPPVPPPADPHAGHDHSGHAHAAHGPNGGHIVELGNAHHVEWLHDDAAGKVTLILLDEAMKDEVKTESPIAAIHVTIGDSAPKTYELPAVADPLDKSFSRFELVEPALVEALSIGEGVKAVLSIEINGKPHSAPIGHAAGDPHDHGHSH